VKNMKNRVKGLFNIFCNEISYSVWSPKRIFYVFNRSKFLGYIEGIKIRFNSWKSCEYAGSDISVSHRTYHNYKAYVKHQKSKLAHIKLDEYDAQYGSALKECLSQIGLIYPGMTVLCLASRIGTEVKSFLGLECFAIGIDLNPGKNNKYVVVGDFHDVQFCSSSVDVVFTNSMDHSFYVEKLIGEMKRLLKSDGILIIEATKGTKGGMRPGVYESFWWESIEDLIKLFNNAGFTLIRRSSFSYPWAGEQMCFKKQDSPGK